MDIKIFDSHFHIIDSRYPLAENEGFVPGFFTAHDYLSIAGDLGITGGAVVAGSYHGFDYRHITEAISSLGPGFVGVAQVKPGISPEELDLLNSSGVRALRFNIKRGVYSDVVKIRELAEKTFTLFGWHAELYLDNLQLSGLTGFILDLPAVSIDHMGLTDNRGLDLLLRLASGGVKFKASGFGRLNLDPETAIREIFAVNKESLMFGTDLPSTRASREFSPHDINMIINTLGEEKARRVLYRNAVSFYGINNIT